MSHILSMLIVSLTANNDDMLFSRMWNVLIFSQFFFVFFFPFFISFTSIHITQVLLSQEHTHARTHTNKRSGKALTYLLCGTKDKYLQFLPFHQVYKNKNRIIEIISFISHHRRYNLVLILHSTTYFLFAVLFIVAYIRVYFFKK